MNQHDIAVTTITVRSPQRYKYYQQTLANLTRAGMFDSPRLAYSHLVAQDVGERSATANAALALAGPASDSAEWTLFLEDDIDVIDGFLDAVGAWLDAYAREDRRVYSFSVPHPAILSVPECLGAAGQVFDYPIDKFCCTQAFAIRRDDARSLSEWLTTHPTVTCNGSSSDGAYDLNMRLWAKATYPTLDYFSAAVPNFVQHVGEISAISPGQMMPVMPGWPGRAYRFEVTHAKISTPERRRTLLFIGDHGCASGFERAARYYLAELHKTWDVHVLAVNYFGDPHNYPYSLYPAIGARIEGDWLGIERIHELMARLGPDCIVIQNDPWNIPRYLRVIEPIIAQQDHQIPVVGVIAVDGKNCAGTKLNGLASAIFWTEFGEQEAREGGYVGRSAVVSLGVDTDVYRPADRREARLQAGLPLSLAEGIETPVAGAPRGAFIVGNVNRNQLRKRLDLTISIFAEWVRGYAGPYRHGVPWHIEDAWLYLHVCPTGERGVDPKQLMKYYGFFGNARKRLILAEPEIGHGVSEADVANVMNCFDVALTTTQGEGFGLPMLELMACGVPCIVPDWSALGEWATAAVRVPCAEIVCTTNGVNVIGGVIDRAACIAALEDVYRHSETRRRLCAAGFALANAPQFRWDDIGRRVAAAIEEAMPEPQRGQITGTIEVDDQLSPAIEALGDKITTIVEPQHFVTGLTADLNATTIADVLPLVPEPV